MIMMTLMEVLMVTETVITWPLFPQDLHVG